MGWKKTNKFFLHSTHPILCKMQILERSSDWGSIVNAFMHVAQIYLNDSSLIITKNVTRFSGHGGGSYKRSVPLHKRKWSGTESDWNIRKLFSSASGIEHDRCIPSELSNLSNKLCLVTCKYDAMSRLIYFCYAFGLTALISPNCR